VAVARGREGIISRGERGGERVGNEEGAWSIWRISKAYYARSSVGKINKGVNR
jgi:hypothetical protein